MVAPVAANPIPVVSLFSGAGGLDYGFAQAGFKTVLAVDHNAAAVATFNKNFAGNVARVGDLASLKPALITSWAQAADEAPMGIIGGPPCQGFSIGNPAAEVDDPRNRLPFQYCEILRSLLRSLPLEFFVFENVLGMRSPKHRQRLSEIIAQFEQLGFVVCRAELNAARFGVAQNRRRLFLVGVNQLRDRGTPFLWPTGSDNLRTVRSVISGLPDPVFRENGMMPADIPHHPNHWASKPCSDKFRTKSFGNGRSFRRLQWDEPSWTVAYGNREVHVHPDGDRRLSILEAMLLQSFPKKFVLVGNFCEQVTQVSNAVPPRVARAVASAIRRQLFPVWPS